jgi:hypothetical protein
MTQMIRCTHCQCFFLPNPRVKNQKYCRKKKCQRSRKKLWQKKKMDTDPDYKANQRDCQKQWRQKNRDYWRYYRKNHPDYAQKNRLLQRARDQKRRLHRLAKMDALEQTSLFKPGSYYLFPEKVDLAKMDALAHKIIIIPDGYRDLAKKDSIAFQHFLQ